jgi:hypothetical protein
MGSSIICLRYLPLKFQVSVAALAQLLHSLHSIVLKISVPDPFVFGPLGSTIQNINIGYMCGSIRVQASYASQVPTC